MPQFFKTLLFAIVISGLTGACGAARTLAKNSAPNPVLMNGADRCSEKTVGAAMDACMGGVYAARDVAIENGRSAAEAAKASQPTYGSNYVNGYYQETGTNQSGTGRSKPWCSNCRVLRPQY